MAETLYNFVQIVDSPWFWIFTALAVIMLCYTATLQHTKYTRPRWLEHQRVIREETADMKALRDDTLAPYGTPPLLRNKHFKAAEQLAYAHTDGMDDTKAYCEYEAVADSVERREEMFAWYEHIYAFQHEEDHVYALEEMQETLGKLLMSYCQRGESKHVEHDLLF